MARKTNPRFRKSLLALAASTALAPYSSWALDLAESPPGTVEPYIRPNVIISVDDSGSMDWQVTNTNTDHLLRLNLKPNLAYRITALAFGRKPGTVAVLQQTYVRQTRKD